jgi:hypothetical protein
MTQETPAKVFSLLGAALFSMALLFSVTLSNASFDKVYSPLPDIGSPTQVVSMLDYASNGYSKFVYANLITPAKYTFAFMGDNAAYAAQNAGSQILQMAGLEGSSQLVVLRPQVAGASIKAVPGNLYSSSGGD